jgi:RNA polymerase sigma-70 factor, ECF subfamily
MLSPSTPKAPGSNAPAIELAALVSGIQGEDPDALSRFYDLTSRTVYASALFITSNAADAEEVTFDVYHQVWRTANRFDPRRGSPIQWVMVMARNRALDCLRRRRGHNTSEPRENLLLLHVAAEESAPEKAVHQLGVASLIEDELCKLAPVEVQVLRLAFFSGLTHCEVAEWAQLPLGTVKSLISRALLKLRAALLIKGTPQAYLDVYPSRAQRIGFESRRRGQRVKALGRRSTPSAAASDVLTAIEPA